MLKSIKKCIKTNAEQTNPVGEKEISSMRMCVGVCVCVWRITKGSFEM